MFKKIQIVFWAVILIGLWGMSLWKFQPREEPIFFQYNVYFGVDWVGPWYLGYVIPVSAVVILVLNWIFIQRIQSQNAALAQIIMAWTSLALILLVVSQMIVFLLNPSS